MIILNNINTSVIIKKREKLINYYQDIMKSISHNLKTPLNGIIAAACKIILHHYSFINNFIIKKVYLYIIAKIA